MSRAYSFMNVLAAITGPGGIFNLGNGAAVSDEGITIDPLDDTGTMTIGADGKGMHSLHAGKACRVTVRLLKTSPVNAQLHAMYDLQRADPSIYGQNVITITDNGSGDSSGCTDVAFARKPTLVYAKVGQMLEWTFNAISHDTVLGTY